mgnify:CR=1 FL=1
MIILLIPDIHLKHKRAQRIIDAAGADINLFLGDIFDDFGDDVRQNVEAAIWFKEKLNDKRNIIIQSNHNFGHQYPKNPYGPCSGWTKEKSDAINKILTKEDWQKTRWHYVAQGYLFTHAGLLSKFLNPKIKTLEDIDKFLTEQGKEADICAATGQSFWFYRAGFCRGGGYAASGGILWCDFNKEWSPIAGIKQIFGHTEIRTPEISKNGDIAIDCRMNYYLTLKDGVPTIHNYADL